MSDNEKENQSSKENTPSGPPEPDETLSTPVTKFVLDHKIRTPANGRDQLNESDKKKD